MFFFQNRFYSPYTAPDYDLVNNNTPPLPPIIPSSSPIIDSTDSITTTPPTPSQQQPTPVSNNVSSSSLSIASHKNKSVVLDNIELLPMTTSLSDPQKHQDTQGAFVTYLVTTKVSPSI